ncbi:MAG: hypothetical protein WAU49_02615 [Steroidobacteraceae bacterium]
MRVAVRVALVAGIAVLIALIMREGSAILVPLARAGRVLLWLVPLHALPVFLDVLIGLAASLPLVVLLAVLLRYGSVFERMERLAGLGVQEASLIGFGALLGVNAELALALSLAKRMREILFGVPALLSWYWVEGIRELQHVRGSGRL